MQGHAYLLFDGTCAQAMQAYADILAGTLQIMRFGENPDPAQIPAGSEERVMHACLQYGEGQVLMASDTLPGHPHQGFSGFHLSLQADTIADAERLFAELHAGGSVSMDLQETFWALRFGMLTDRFGVPWMVNLGRDEGAR